MVLGFRDLRIFCVVQRTAHLPTESARLSEHGRVESLTWRLSNRVDDKFRSQPTLRTLIAEVGGD